MRESIATIENVKGPVSAVEVSGAKRLLSSGDALYMDEIVRTAKSASAAILIQGSEPLILESLQNVRLTADVSPQRMPDKSDAVLAHELSLDLVEHLFSAYPLAESSILTEIEPVYDIERFKSTQQTVEVAANGSSGMETLLPSANTNDSLGHYLRFDELEQSTVIYFSHSGNFTALSAVEDHADRVITINSIGYNNSAELLGFLIDSYLSIDQL